MNFATDLVTALASAANFRVFAVTLNLLVSDIGNPCKQWAAVNTCESPNKDPPQRSPPL